MRPDFAEARSNLLLTLQYQSGASLAELAAAHAVFEQVHAAPLRTAWRPSENVPDPQRRLRVGFISPDFGRHPVGYFLVSALESLDRTLCETLCYNDRLIKDELTLRLQAAAATWREAAGLDDRQLADQILRRQGRRSFRPGGPHRGQSTVSVRPQTGAPPSDLGGLRGYTGLKAIDYILADRYEIPPEAEAHYCERVLRMPQGYVCYAPPAYAPPVSPLPALDNGFTRSPPSITRPS